LLQKKPEYGFLVDFHPIYHIPIAFCDTPKIDDFFLCLLLNLQKNAKIQSLKKPPNFEIYQNSTKV